MNPQAKMQGGGISQGTRFDKFIGADRSMGEDYVKADRKQARLTSGTGGATAKVNIPNTRHGKIDMPYHSVRRYTGMKAGGAVRKFAAGGTLERLAPEQSFNSAFSEARKSGADTFMWRGKKYTTEMAKPKKAAPSNMDARDRGAHKITDYGDESARLLSRVPVPASIGSSEPYEYRKGGQVDKAKMELRHAGAMKKAGLPKSMVREEMAEAKKFARGGGIESRGKTRGKIVKMAGGGSVRGGGCEQRGKTRGKML